MHLMNYCKLMKNVYVHLGYPKTGSTFLQKKVFPQFKNFKIFNRPHNERLKIFDILLLNEKEFNIKKNKLINFVNKEFKNNKNFIITNESFLHSNYFFSIKVNNIIKRFKKIFPKKKYNLNFFFFIRKPANFIPSYYSECYRDIIKIDSKWKSYENFLISLNNQEAFYKYFHFSKMFQKLLNITNQRCKIFLFEDIFFNTNKFNKEFVNYFKLKNFKIIIDNKKIIHFTKKISKNEYERKRVPIHKLFKKKQLIKKKKLLNIIYKIFTIDKVLVNKKNNSLISKIFKNTYKNLPNSVLKKINAYNY